MPRYFFHLHNDVDTEDEEGQALAGETEARARAAKYAREMVCESIRQNGHVNLDHSIVVAGEDGAELFTVRFGEVFEVIG